MYKLIKVGDRANYITHEYFCNDFDDMMSIPVNNVPTYSIAYIINTQDVYVLNSNKEWIIQAEIPEPPAMPS